MHKHGLAIPKSTKCHYSYHDAMLLKDRGWNDGKFLADKMAYEAFVKHRLERARNELSMRRGGSIRSGDIDHECYSPKGTNYIHPR